MWTTAQWARSRKDISLTDILPEVVRLGESRKGKEGISK